MSINGTAENDNLLGTAENDSIFGALGDDTLRGALGDDSLFGGLGDDLLNGGLGDDFFNFGAGANTIIGGPGSDRIELDFPTLSADFVLTYNLFDEVSLTEDGIFDGTEIEGIERIDITSGSGDDSINIAATRIGGIIIGGAGNDSLIGGLGDDSLNGEAGDDTFFGGAGNDLILGGAGNDASVYIGLRTDYEVTIDEGLATVSGIAIENLPENLPEGSPDPSIIESFTDDLAGVEIILFDDGEIVVATGEFILFEDDVEDDGLDIPVDSVVEPDSVPEPELVEENLVTETEDVEVYRFIQTDTETQFYTTNETERDAIIETLPEFELEGVAFVGAAPPPDGEDITGLSPVYRFFNTTTGVHLYTVNEAERAFIEENLDNYVFEGTPFYSFDEPEEGTVPLYRFYNPSLDAHFLTTSEAERDFFDESPDFQIEGGADGIVFYVEPAPIV